MEENNENNIIDDNIIKEVTFNPTEIIDQNKNIQSIFQQVDNFLEDCLLEKKNFTR